MRQAATVTWSPATGQFYPRLPVPSQKSKLFTLEASGGWNAVAPVLFVLVMVVHVTMLDFAAPRFIAPFDGDGHQCVAGYLLHDEPWRRVFGASCVWRVRCLATLLSTMLRD